MSKDPAFLFYSSDFITATMLMTNEQVGKYIRLMCLQHQSGHLREKDMLNICGSYDEDIFRKFVKDDQGFYYDEQLEQEIDRRKKYSESRRLNRSNKQDMTNISKTYDQHMETETETETETRTRTRTVTETETEKPRKPKKEKKEEAPVGIQSTEAWKGYSEMRTRIKKPLSPRSITMALSQLEKLAPGDQATQEAILDQSTFHCWQGVFELKEDANHNGARKERGVDERGRSAQAEAICGADGIARTSTGHKIADPNAW